MRDVAQEAYETDRDQLTAEQGLGEATTDHGGILTQAAALLRDRPVAWDAATPRERNALARLVPRAREIRDDQGKAVIAQAAVAPFFVENVERATASDFLHANGPDRAGPSDEVLNGRKRRGSLESLLATAQLIGRG